MNIAPDNLKELNKISSAVVFKKILNSYPQTKTILKRISTLPLIFLFNRKGRRRNRKDRLFLPKCHSWKQRSVTFSFVLSNPRGAMQAGASLCLFICPETTHKGKASLSRAETFVFSLFLFPVELSL